MSTNQPPLDRLSAFTEPWQVIEISMCILEAKWSTIFFTNRRLEKTVHEFEQLTCWRCQRLCVDYFEDYHLETLCVAMNLRAHERSRPERSVIDSPCAWGLVPVAQREESCFLLDDLLYGQWIAVCGCHLTQSPVLFQRYKQWVYACNQAGHSAQIEPCDI